LEERQKAHPSTWGVDRRTHGFPAMAVALEVALFEIDAG
jgi:hypothetical protein